MPSKVGQSDNRKHNLAKNVTTKKDRLKDKFSKKKEPGVPIYKLFSYSDWKDKILIAIGLLSAIISGVIFPFCYRLYGKVAATFVDYENSFDVYNSSNTSYGSDRCISESSLNTDYDGRVNGAINLFVILAFVFLFMNYLVSVCFNTAAERQIKRISESTRMVPGSIGLKRLKYRSRTKNLKKADNKIENAYRAPEPFSLTHSRHTGPCLRYLLFESILRQDIAFFDKNSPGELNSIMTANLENLKGTIDYKFSDFISQLTRGIACIVFALISAWKFTIVFMAIVPLMVISLNLMIHYLKKYSIQEFVSYGESGKIAQECLSSIRTVISFGIQHKALDIYDEKLITAEKVSIKKSYLKGFFEGAYFGLFNIIFGIAIVYAVYLNQVDCKDYYVSNLISAFFCIVTSSVSLGQAIPFLSTIGSSKGIAKKIFDTINLKSAIDFKNTNTDVIEDLKGNISFSNVYFNYPQRPEAKILKGLTLDIPAGKTVAFVGASGCGKSTTFGLLERFYLPLSGEIKIDGKKIDDLDINWLRSQIALVSQEPLLFTGTIRSNIRLGRLDATNEEIYEVAKKANAHEFIMKLHNGYETKVGERGTALSGGQKQRIAIARALIRNPKILLLDEATSALDNESERVVQNALDKAKVGRTTLIIAHRLTTIRNADLIFSFEDGKLKEQGKHDELMDLKGIYYELVTRQTLKKKDVQATVVHEEVSDEDSEENYSDSDEEVFEEEKVANKNAEETLSKSEKRKYSFKKLKKKKLKPLKLEKNLLKLQQPEIIWNIIGTVSQLINGAILPLLALLFCEIYNIFNIADKSEQTKKSLEYMGGIFAIGVVNFIVIFLYNYSFGISGAKITKRLRSKMFESMLRQEIGFHDLDKNRSSILATQLAINPPYCKGLTSDKIGTLCQGFSGVGFAIIFSLSLNIQLSLVMLLFVPVSFFSGVFAGRSSTGNVKVKGKYSIEEGGRILIESVENIRTIVSLGRETYLLKEMKKLFELNFNKTLAMLHVQAFFYTISNSLILFIQITAFTYGWQLIKSDGLATANLYKIYAMMTFSSLILGRVYSSIPDQKKARDSTKTAFAIINRVSKIDAMSTLGLKPEKLVGNIEFKNVEFEYPSSPGIKILQNFNLSIKKGETNALVGQSGSGKSTTVSLLLRFYDVIGGSVELDGVNIKELNIQWLRSQIGIVSQEPVLYDYSIRENITDGDLSRKDISIEEVIQASRDANIHSRIESLPENYETKVGLKGSQLSGGEKQRIAIARALIRSPAILLLDEATSALDTQSETIVQDALDRAQKGRTCIVIAHRLSTIEKSDKICVVQKGAVAEQGTHEELMELKNLYFMLQNPNYKFKNAFKKISPKILAIAALNKTDEKTNTNN